MEVGNGWKRDGVMYVGVSVEDKRSVLILLKGFLMSDENWCEVMDPFSTFV